jgi:hypothetical protein
MDKVRFLADLLIGDALRNAGKKKQKYSVLGIEHAEQLHEEEVEEAAAEHDNLETLVTGVLEEWQKSNWKDNFQIDTLRMRADDLLNNRKPFHWLLEFPEVFAGKVIPDGASKGQPISNSNPTGFDAIVSNPPFMGGQKITGNFGTDYRDFLVEYLAYGQRGSADLVAYFFLRTNQTIRQSGFVGLLATNTISQGDTREVGLEQITRNGSTIYRAIPSRKWEGAANLEVAFVWFRRDLEWQPQRFLDENRVSGITPLLTAKSRISGTPFRLVANEDKSFQGSIVLGMGFVLTPEEAAAIIQKNEKNKLVLFPYLNGEDINSSPEQDTTRWVINFQNFPLERIPDEEWFLLNENERDEQIKAGRVSPDYHRPVARDFPDCLEIVIERVKPERDKLADGNSTAQERSRRWWQFARPTMKMYSHLQPLECTLTCAQVSKFHAIAIVKTGYVFSMMCVVFPTDSRHEFAILQSSIHEAWVRNYQSSLETRGRYTPSDCFETFPFPRMTDGLYTTGTAYHEFRGAMMLDKQQGLTDTYNHFHNRNDNSTDIEHLRKLHCDMDEAVKLAYGWDDLALDHGFHVTKQGIRFTISPEARQEILDRLLELNHRRYAEEDALGLHDKGAKKKKAASKKTKKQAPARNNSSTQATFEFMPEQKDLF